MTMLIITPNLTSSDTTYAHLIATHENLTETESHALNARLVLILINHIGDANIIEQAIGLARMP